MWNLCPMPWGRTNAILSLWRIEQSSPPPNIVIFVCHRFFRVAKIRQWENALGTSVNESEDKLEDADDHKKENFKDKC